MQCRVNEAISLYPPSHGAATVQLGEIELTSNMNDWREYQEAAATYFRSLGLQASVDTTVNGVRTTHNVDVLVKSAHAGFDVMWVVECKHWATPVSKLHVLALREIVADVGADRGILLCEAGFQSGAQEAAQLTNVQATSLAEMQSIAGPTIYSMRLLDLIDRITLCKDRYWNIPKEIRIASGLRAVAGEHNYSGNRVIEMCSDLVSRAIGGRFPFVSETPGATMQFGANHEFGSARKVVQVVDAELTQLERKLDAHDRAILTNFPRKSV